MISNLASIGIDKPIPGLNGISYNRCTTLADVLAAMVAQAGSGADVYTVSGVYDDAAENIVLTLSNGATVTIPASLLLPVLADGSTIRGNGTNGNPLVGYQVLYDGATGALTILPPTSAPVVIPAQSATTEGAVDVQNLLGNGVGATVTTQQLIDYLAAHLRDCCPSGTQEIPAGAFADPVNPTQIEAQTWIDNHGPFKVGTQIIYNRFVGGDVEDPDYVWLVNEIGDATHIESPEAIKAGASLINATAAGIAQNVASNAAFSQIVYQENAVAATGANSSITIQEAGRYLINASVWWASEDWTQECGIHGFINVNGAVVRAGGRLDHSRKLVVDPVNGGASKFLSYSTAISCILPLNAGDVVTFTVVHDDIVAHNLLTTSGYSWFEVEKM